jgi:TetR/AcrR family transcriptional regulator, cholesterol catabolism regulator
MFHRKIRNKYVRETRVQKLISVSFAIPMTKITAVKNGSRKDAITKKAAVLFRQKGFTSSSMRELAEMVGVEAPSLYNHIGSKSELLQSICFAVANDFNTHLSNVTASASANKKKIETLIRFHIRMMIESYDEVFVANHEWKQLEEPFLSNFLSQRKTYENNMAAVIADGIREKEFVKIHPHVAVLTILSAVRGLEFWHRHRKSINKTELENDMVTHLLNGLSS